MIKVYFAGPDIFYPDYEQHKLKIRGLCLRSGIEPLFPDDNNLTDPHQICLSNIGLIKQADAVIANLNPFRSILEPDSGTAFECGLAFGMAKNIIGYVEDLRPQVEKLGKKVSADGSSVEDFGLPVNLMLAYCLDLASSLEEAILHLCQIKNLPKA
ncbi:nucleoside 2-deoxyribosyltransferase [Neisseria sp. Ec49-e6-T10]|uniref:nucleoside 2-deoxyribosyltransferase n=1 Tax=Neisseria sp. Ec49-e6-T10 TaxID=3140744 RepID=UPI003EB715D4